MRNNWPDKPDKGRRKVWREQELLSIGRRNDVSAELLSEEQQCVARGKVASRPEIQQNGKYSMRFKALEQRPAMHVPSHALTQRTQTLRKRMAPGKGEKVQRLVERLTRNKASVHHLLVCPPSFINLGQVGLGCEDRRKTNTKS